MSASFKVFAMALAAQLALGCGSDPKPKPKVGNGLAGRSAPTAQRDNRAGATDAAKVAPVSIDDRVAKMCNLPESHFDFDSSRVSPSARRMLEALAKCFISGPAKGKTMIVEGHADNTGTPDYNMGLGHRRATSVATYLKNKGLKGQIDVTSRGELEATGEDTQGRARDRRVKIFLAE